MNSATRPAEANTRVPTLVLHLSDIHFSVTEPAQNDSFRRFNDAPIDLAKEVVTAWRGVHPEENPHCVIASGDFAQNGKDEEFARAARFLKELQREFQLSREDVVHVPGNHDIDWTLPDDENKLDRYTHHLREFGKASRHPFTTHWMNERQGVFVLGIDSCRIEHQARSGLGHVNTADINEVFTRFENLWQRCASRILVLHHHPMPVSWAPADPKAQKPTLLFNAVEVMQRFAEHGFGTLLHGHQHAPFVSRHRSLRSPDLDPRERWVDTLVLGAPSLKCPADEVENGKDRGFNILRVSHPRVEFQSVRISHPGNSVPGPVRSLLVPTATPSPARRQIYESLAARATDVLGVAHAEVGSPEPSLLVLTPDDVMTMAPSIYRAAHDTVAAVSNGGPEFWNTSVGQRIRESTRTAGTRRLFIADRYHPGIHDAMADQTAHKVDCRFLEIDRYVPVMKAAVWVLLGELRTLLQSAAAPVPEAVTPQLFADLVDNPERLGVAIYGPPDDPPRQFVGFDFAVRHPKLDAVIGLAFDLSKAVFDAVRDAWGRAWEAAGPRETPGVPTVVLLGAHRWGRTRAITEAVAAGFRVVLGQTARDHEPIGPDVLALTGTSIRLTDNPDPTEFGRFRSRPGDSVCAVGLDDYVLTCAANLGRRTDIVTIPPASVAVVHEKHQLRKLWNVLAGQNDQFAPVDYWLWNGETGTYDPDTGPVPADDTSFIVKPDALSASVCVRSVRGGVAADRAAKELPALLLKQVGKYAEKCGVPLSPAVLVEREIARAGHLHPGAEYSVEVLTLGGQHAVIGITQKWTATGFLEVAHVFPAQNLPASVGRVMREAALDLLRPLNVRYALSHWEFIVTGAEGNEKVALVEGHLRPAGDRIMDVVGYSTGRHPFRDLFDGLAGRRATPDAYPADSPPVVIVWLKPTTPLDTVTTVVQSDQPREGVLRVEIDAAALTCRTEPWTGPTWFGDRYICVVVEGRDLTQLGQRIRDAAASIRLQGTTGGTAAETSLEPVTALERR